MVREEVRIPQQKSIKKVMVIGVDCMIYDLVREYSEQGMLPNLSKLIDNSNIPLQLSENHIYLSLDRGLLLESKKFLAGGLNPFARTEPSCILKEFLLLDCEKFILLSVARYRKEKREIFLNYNENKEPTVL